MTIATTTTSQSIGKLHFMSGKLVPLYRSQTNFGAPLKGFLSALCGVDANDPRILDFYSPILKDHKQYVYIHTEVNDDDTTQPPQMMLQSEGFIWILRTVAAKLQLSIDSKHHQGQPVIDYVDEAQREIQACFREEAAETPEQVANYWEYLRAIGEQKSMLFREKQRILFLEKHGVSSKNIVP